MATVTRATLTIDVSLTGEKTEDDIRDAVQNLCKRPITRATLEKIEHLKVTHLKPKKNENIRIANEKKRLIIAMLEDTEIMEAYNNKEISMGGTSFYNRYHKRRDTTITFRKKGDRHGELITIEFADGTINLHCCHAYTEETGYQDKPDNFTIELAEPGSIEKIKEKIIEYWNYVKTDRRFT